MDDKCIRDNVLNEELVSKAFESPKKRPANERPIHCSPAKKLRLELPKPAPAKHTNDNKSNFKKYIYGNYNRYYGYRNEKNSEDLRLVAFEKYAEFFDDNEILDVGCNEGSVTIAIAKKFHIKFITGIDIDSSLITKARKHVIEEKQAILDNNDKTIADATNFPQNIAFKTSNYVLHDDRLLDVDEQCFDTILCLSVTKWIHLNFGDNGLKRAFKRMFKQLNDGGVLILEPQPWKGYKRRKNLSPSTKANYESIKLKPDQFQEYLLSEEVGFKSCTPIELPAEHPAKGFQRPIFVYRKGDRSITNQNGINAIVSE